MIEKMILSFLIKNPENINNMNNIFEENKDLFTKIMVIYEKYQTLNPAIMIENGINANAINDLINISCNKKDFESAIKILEENNKTKYIQSIVHNLAHKNISYSEASLEITKILNTVQRSNVNNVKHIKDIMKDFLENEPEPGLQTGYWGFDSENDGLYRGELTIIAARPSTGKSAVLTNLMASMYQNYSIGYFSAEMKNRQNLINLTANQCRIDNLYLRRNGIKLKADESMKIASKYNKISEYDIFIDDTCAIDIDDLYMSAKYMHNQYAIDILFVDYLQLLSTKHQGKRHEQIGHITKKLKTIARNLNIPVVTACQINRTVDRMSDDYEPVMSDLKDSGDIEQDADMILFLQKVNKDKLVIDEKEKYKDDKKVEIIKVTTGKNRCGSTPLFYLKFTKNYCLMENYKAENIVGKVECETKKS